MIRALALFLILASPALAAEDPEKDLLDLQQSMESIVNTLGQSTRGVSMSQLDLARRKVFSLAEDKQFLGAVNQLWASPDRNLLLICQGVFFLVMLLFRAWRQAKATNWFTRLCVGFFCSLVMYAGLLYVIPAIVLGEPYRILVATLWRLLTTP